MKSKSILTAIFGFLLGCEAFAQSAMRIAAQEGDDRFFPLLTAVYGQMKISVSYEILPSLRALSAVNEGAYQAEVGRIREISEKYPNIRYSKESLLNVELMALTTKNSTYKLSKIEDLKNRRIGYVIGMSVAEYFVKDTQLNVFPVATHQQLAQMLESGRVDVALMGTAFRDSPVFKIGHAGLKIASFDVFHIDNKKHENLIPSFDAVLRQLKTNGQYEKLLSAAAN